MSNRSASHRSVREALFRVADRASLFERMTMLATISLMTGLCGGVLALIQAQRQPDKARQLRLFSLVPFGMAALLAVLYFL